MLIGKSINSALDCFIPKSARGSIIFCYKAAVCLTSPGIPDGKVVGMFAFGKDGIGSGKKQLIPTIEAFGGSLIAQVNKGDSYSFLAKKGECNNM